MPHSTDPPRPSGSAWTLTRRFMKDPFSLLDEARKECGDVFSIRILGLGDWTFLCTPELLRQLYSAPEDVLAAGEVNRPALGFLLGDDATFCLDGDAHHERQRLVLRNLSGKRVLQHTELIRRATEEAIAEWPRGEPFPLLEKTHELALEILMRIVLGVEDRERARELAANFDVFASRGCRSPLLMMPLLRVDLGVRSPWGKILALRRTVVEAFAEEIDRRFERGKFEESSDFLGCLIHESKESGRPLSRQALIDETVNLIFAGHETTSLGVTWVTERLLSNPEVLARVREEVDAVTGGRPIEASHVQELGYLAAVLIETLRWQPFAPMASLRKVKKPFVAGDYTVPVGRIVTQAFSVMCRRPETFPEPERFDPDRFYQKKIQRYAWQPFGGGRHACLGKGLAEVELPIILATLHRNVELRLAQETVRPVRAGFFFAPNDGLRVVLDSTRGG